jgi:hypothetical protein
MNKIQISLLGALLFIFCFICEAKAQTFFANAYGGSGYDYAYSIEQTTDGGYAFCGPGTFGTGAGGMDFWVVKLDASGGVTWSRTYGGASDDIPNAMQQTSDGGYIVAGRTLSFGAGGYDYWVLKLTSTGVVTWQRTYGGSKDDMAYSVRQASDGGYFVAGWTLVSGTSNYDYWILKLDSSGNILWQRTYGGSSLDVVYASHATADGGVVVAGGATSFGAGGYDVWILKLDSLGNVSWQQAYGGSADDFVLSIDQTTDGVYISAGRTTSYGVGTDFWVLKLDPSGVIEWQKTYGGSALDWAFAVQQTVDGGYIVGGRTDSFGVGTDLWILKLDAIGNITWQKTYGGTALDYAYSVGQARDGSLLVGGVTGSFGAGSYDAVVLKLESSCMSGSTCPYMSNTSVVPGTPSPSILTTTRSPVTTSISPGTPTYSTSSATVARAVQCAYSNLPGAVFNTLTLTKSGNAPRLQWQVPGGTCAVTGYGIYRGTFPIFPYNHQSLDCTVTVLNYTDGSAGGNQYYLVVPLNTYTEGSYGARADGSTTTERPPASSPCKPQCLLACP